MDVVDAARTLPMMVPRRVVLLMHAERLLNPEEGERRLLEGSRSARRLREGAGRYLVPCAGGRRSRQAPFVDQAVARESRGGRVCGTGAMCMRRRGGFAIASRRKGRPSTLARRAWLPSGPGRISAGLRSDVERLVIYAGENKAITEADVKEVVGAATSQDDWGVTRAIERGSAA